MPTIICPKCDGERRDEDGNKCSECNGNGQTILSDLEFQKIKDAEEKPKVVFAYTIVEYDNGAAAVMEKTKVGDEEYYKMSQGAGDRIYKNNELVNRDIRAGQISSIIITQVNEIVKKTGIETSNALINAAINMKKVGGNKR